MSTAEPVEWQERQQLSTSEWTYWYSAPTPLPGLPTEGTTISGIRYEWRALVLESDYLAERKAREAAEALVRRYEETRPRATKSWDELRARVEAAEAKIAELNSINSKLCEMMDEELENAKAWEAKAEAAEADARRYRWLRNWPTHFAVDLWGQYGAGLRTDQTFINTPERLDAAIDAAMRSTQERHRG